jgi:hypothetical protein
MKFRIIEIISDAGSSNRKGGCFVIEEKKWLRGWKEIFSREVKIKRISYSTYGEAERYMYKNYMGHGVCERDGNYYTYTAYEYYV